MAREYYFTGSAAPATTPTYAGSTFIDTTAGRVYNAKGTSSSADWVIIPNAISEIAIDADVNLQGVRRLTNALALDFQPATELTVASGVVVQTQSIHTLDTQADAATDDLDTITIVADSSFLTVRLEDNARVVTLKHGTGNLNLPAAADVIMTANTLYILMYDGSNWNMVSS